MSSEIDPVGYIESRYNIPLKRVTQDEYAGPCPFCGGEDRFHVWTKGNFWCRPGPGHCGRKGWVDELDDNHDPPSQEELLERRVRELERKQQEQEERLRKLEKIHNCTDHIKYHNRMTNSQREYWYREGIFDEAIDTFMLGYAPQCPTAPYTDSYTIPVFDYNHALCNIRHRLVDESKGKYRPHMSGLPQQLFNAPILAKPKERILVVEGEKKAVVANQHNFPSVGLMGKNFKWKRKWFELFRPHGEIIIALDPDAIDSAERLGLLFAENGFDNVRVARFPTKPDDFITLGGAGKDDFEVVLGYARKVA